MAGLPFPKQSKTIYEKYLTSKHLLQNLRTYNLAAGNSDPLKVTTIREKYGDDDGRVFGTLIKGEVNKEGKKRQHRDSYHKKIKKRKKLNNTKQTKDKNDSEDESDDDKSEGDSEDDNSGHIQSSLIQLVADYDSDNEEEEPKKLEIPQAIQELYQEEEKEESLTTHQTKPADLLEHTVDSDSDPDCLGYFQEASSGSDHEEFNNKSQTNQPSSLSTYTCWKCGKVGHLSEDCTVQATKYNKKKTKIRLSEHLKKLFAQCKDIKSGTGNFCSECGSHNNLVHCLDCRSTLCDGYGHLTHHLLEHPSHNKLYSYKLGRLMKCCKADCDVVNVYELLMCSHCLGKAFSQHYSMISATWSRTGLKKIPNALCCEEHFQWHRMNCSNSAEEHLVSRIKVTSNSSGFVSDFFF